MSVRNRTIDTPIKRHFAAMHCVARAVYDNVAEAPDELSFHKGDFLTVLEQNTAGMQGWWLCSLRGRQGICPANRLRLVPRLYDTTGGVGQSFSTLGHSALNKETGETDASTKLDYDVPRSHRLPKEFKKLSVSAGDYDVPRAIGASLPEKQRLSHRSSGVSLLSSGSSSASITSLTSEGSESLSLSTSCLSAKLEESSSCSSAGSVNSINTYDIPKPFDGRRVDSQTPELSSSKTSVDSPDPVTTYVRRQVSSGRVPRVTSLEKRSGKLLENDARFIDIEWDLSRRDVANFPLNLNTALETVLRLDREVSTLTAGFSSTLRRLDSPLELQLLGVRLRAALQELLDFCEAASGNASVDSDIGPKFQRLVELLRTSHCIVQETTKALDEGGWKVGLKQRSGTPTDLDRLAACCCSLAGDVHQVASFMQCYGHVLFPKEVPGLEDYDYVNFESKAKFDSENEQVKRSLPDDARQKFESLVNQSECEVPTYRPISAKDRSVADFYSGQADVYLSYLTNAIDAFISTVEQNQPPKVFVTYSKFVILNAHKLLCMGDAVHRNISNGQLVRQCTDKLCGAMQVCVKATKRAGFEFPSVEPIQLMLDSVVNLSHSARELKAAVSRAAQEQ